METQAQPAVAVEPEKPPRAPDPAQLEKAYEKGERDALLFLHDRRPGGELDGAWIAGVAAAFAGRLLPFLRRPQAPLRSGMDVRLPLKSRLRLLWSGRLRVSVAMAVRGAEPVQAEHCFMALECAGTELEAEVIEPPEQVVPEPPAANPDEPPVVEPTGGCGR